MNLTVLLDRPLQRLAGGSRTGVREGAFAWARALPLICAAGALLLHLFGNAHYGFFRDELYFIVCGRRPAFGYVDQPSLVPLLAAFSQLGGISLFALRAVPAVFAALATYVACVLALEFGGGAFAVLVAGLVTIVAPEMLAFGARLSPDTVQMLIWPLMALVAYRIVRGADARLWMVFALLVAVGAWAKYSVAFFAVSLIAGIAFTRERHVLRSPWFAAGAALSVLLVAPNVFWQWHYGFPMLQLLHNDYDKFMLKWPPFPIQQIMVMSPLLSIVWIAGLWWVLKHPQMRFLGLAYIVLIGMMWTLDAKAYYPAAVYPVLIAAGAVPIEDWTGVRKRWRTAMLVLITAFAVPSIPFVLPVVPLPTYLKYQVALGNLFHIKFHIDNGGNGIPIQYYGDMTGWPQLESQVAQAYDGLSPAERAHAAIYAHNFGEASAIDLYGRADRLPPALSGNNNYWIWGTHGASGQVVIDVNGPELLRNYRTVTRAGTFHNPTGMPYENDFPIWILRSPKAPLASIWPSLKNYSYAFGGM
ncbi:MAG TPA: glycosyltransferase family 39 protein [Candidatus Baltobacteraceae bacterium]|nr:glycosyltransferase family 39 protein [Candidatus Baltobacteraceae bacterium]